MFVAEELWLLCTRDVFITVLLSQNKHSIQNTECRKIICKAKWIELG